MKTNHKARITYRFDQNEPRRQGRPAGTQQPMEEVVIPLYQEEFEVRETTPAVTPAAADKHGSEGPVTSADRAERQEVESLFESHALNTFTTDFGNWNSAIETEGERVERIIRESQTAREHAAREHAVREHPAREPIVQDDYGPGPERDPSRDEEHRDTWSAWTNQGPYVEPGTGARYAKSSGTPWLRIATSIAGAVITGVAFGFLVLSMFSSEPNKGATTGGKTATSVQTPSSGKSVAANGGAAAVDPAAGSASATASASAKPGDQAAAAASGVGVTPVQIAAKTYAFLQNGVFSSPQSAQAAQDSLRKKGLASAQDGSDKPAVFVGFAASRDDALALSQQLQVQDKSLEVYVKNVDIPGVTGIRWSGSKPESVVSFITEGDKLVKAISGLTVIHLAETKPTALADSSLQTIRTSHQSLTTLSSSVSEGAGDDVKPLVQKMTTALGSAVQSMEEYKKSPSTAMLWQAQSSMMQYILSQKDLLKKVSVS